MEACSAGGASTWATPELQQPGRCRSQGLAVPGHGGNAEHGGPCRDHVHCWPTGHAPSPRSAFPHTVPCHTWSDHHQELLRAVPSCPSPTPLLGAGADGGLLRMGLPMPFPALVERYQMSRWKGSCHFLSHSSAQLINRRCQTNKLFLLPIDSNLLAPREPRIVYPTCHPCIAAVLTSALLPSPFLPIFLWGRARHSHGAHSALHHCQLYPGMQLQLGLLLLLGMADTLHCQQCRRESVCPLLWHPCLPGVQHHLGVPWLLPALSLAQHHQKGCGCQFWLPEHPVPSPGHAHQDKSRISLLSQREAAAAHTSAFDACLLSRRLIKV